MEERISALWDGECSVGEVREILDQAETSPEFKARLAAQWNHHGLVRDALAGGGSMRKAAGTDSEHFCAGVMSAIAAEPARPVPKPASKVVELPARDRPAFDRPAQRSSRRRAPLMGWAAAASITLVVLAGSRIWTHVGEKDSAAILAANSQALPLEQTRPVALAETGPHAGLVPVSSRSATEDPPELRWTQLDPDTASELNAYLLEHNSSRADQGMNGALGYARLAARRVEYRSDNPSH